MSRRDLLALAPLLLLYLAAWALFPARPDDEAMYVTLARRLSEGFYATGDQGALLDPDPTSPDLWFGPGLPALLAPLVALDVPLSLLRLTGPLLLFGAVLVFHLLVRERWGPRVGRLASYGIGLYLPFLGLLSNLHSEVLAVLFVTIGMLSLSRFLNRGGTTWLVLGAGAFAGLALTRVAYGWVLIISALVLVAYSILRRSRASLRGAAVLALALVLCVPWLAYTHQKTHRLFVWGNSGSLSLYWMTSPYEGDRGDWNQAHLVFTDPDLRPHRAFFNSLRGLTLAEQNAEIEREAIHNIVEHPARYAENVAANISRMLVNAPYSRTAWEANDLFYALPNLLLLGAVVASLVLLLPRRRELPPETGVFVTFGTVAFTLHALVAAYPRMLAPIVPLVVWLTVLAFVEAGVLRRAAAPGTRALTGSS